MQARRATIAYRIRRHFSTARCWLFLRKRVAGRIKLRGRLDRVTIHSSFRCDGDLWLGIHSEEGEIVIEAGVTASGPLIVTAVRPLRIGAGCLFGPNVLVTDHYHGNPRDATHVALSPSERPLYSPGEILIGKDVQFGANSVILSPARIGGRAIIGANAIVKGEVPSGSIRTGFTNLGSRSVSRITGGEGR
jgi:acetyltransferase-like isoleucine patch superfamily enzyme